MPSLDEALPRRDLAAILEHIDDEPHQGSRAADVLGAWEWAAASEDAPRFARSLLRVLATSFPDVRVAAGWVDATGLDLADRAMDDVDDADGPTIIHGTLLTLEPSSEAALERWLEAVEDADGYFYPDSLYKAYSARHWPELDPERRAELRAIELLASFSLTARDMGRDKACEYLARDRRSSSALVSDAALERARRRLEDRGGFELPSAAELER